MSDVTVRVSYLELTRSPAPIGECLQEAHIARERLSITEYLDLYRRIGESFRWDQRLRMPRADLIRLIESERSAIYVLRDNGGKALGLCEFERCPQEIELKNFGLIPTAHGKGLGSWLLRTALHCEWKLQPGRIWLHTDNWDHPAAMHAYASAGFRVYSIREEPPGDL